MKKFNYIIYKYFFSVCIAAIILLSCTTSSLASSSQKDSIAPYFQQKVDYNILVSIDDKTQTITTSFSMDYQNNSRDTLTELLFHYYPLAYTTDESAYAREQVIEGSRKFYQSKSRLENSSLSLSSTDKLIYEQVEGNVDVLKVKLQESILPGKTVTIQGTFSYVMPEVFSRMGYSDSAYYLTQWYPKPAVYDQNGWHAFPYYDNGEFFSEYGDYNVSLDVPCDFVVGSTGKIMDKNEMAWMRNKTLTQSNCSEGRKTLTLKQERVHDFAIVASPEFEVTYDSIMIDDRIIDILTYSKDIDSSWMKAAFFTKRAIEFLSREVGSYEYDHFSTIDGKLGAGVGMEYPALTILAEIYDENTLEAVIVHEVAHNWFYGMLGSNEREAPYIDEGLTTFYEQKYAAKYGLRKDFNGLFSGGQPINVQEFLIHDQAQLKNLKPICRHARSGTSEQYYISNYLYAPIKYAHLEAYMGVGSFRQSMRTLFANKKNQHISLSDIRKATENSSDLDLSWFYDNALCDETLYEYELMQENNDIVLAHNAPYEMPLIYKVKKNNRETMHATLPFRDTSYILIEEQGFSPTIKLLDSIHLDRRYRTHTLIDGKKSKHHKIDINLGIGISHTSRYPIFLVPIPGYNAYDKTLLGVAIHNITTPRVKGIRSLEYQLVPYFSTGQKTLAGLGKVQYNIWPISGIEKIELFATGKKFGERNNAHYGYTDNYFKLTAGIILDKNHQSTFLKSKISYRHIFLAHKSGYGLDFTEKRWQYNYRQNNYDEITYLIENSHPINPWNAKAAITYSEENLRATFSYKVSHHFKNQFVIDYRAFLGLASSGDTPTGFTQIVSGGKSSPFNYDYTYDEVYLGRTESQGIEGQQYNPIGLDLRTALNLPYGNKAIGMEMGVKVPIVPVRLYMSGAISLESDHIFSKQVTYTGGLDIPILQDYIHMYIPLLVSPQLRDIYELNNVKFQDRILWQVRLKGVDLHNIMNNIF